MILSYIIFNIFIVFKYHRLSRSYWIWAVYSSISFWIIRYIVNSLSEMWICMDLWMGLVEFLVHLFLCFHSCPIPDSPTSLVVYRGCVLFLHFLSMSRDVWWHAQFAATYLSIFPHFLVRKKLPCINLFWLCLKSSPANSEQSIQDKCRKAI